MLRKGPGFPHIAEKFMAGGGGLLRVTSAFKGEEQNTKNPLFISSLHNRVFSLTPDSFTPVTLIIIPHLLAPGLRRYPVKCSRI